MTDPNELRELREGLKEAGQAVLQIQPPGERLNFYPWDTPWLDDEAFVDIYDKIRDNTLVDCQRCHTLYGLVSQINNVPGDILEVGVWRGGVTALLAQTAPYRQIWAADTFTGVVKASEHDPMYKGGEHDDTSRTLVENFLGEMGVHNVAILEGIFPEDTGEVIAERALALVHLDVDTHDSVADAFTVCWPNVSPAGIVIFDDYGLIAACGGIKAFVDTIKDDSDKLFIPNLNGQAYIIKR